MATIKGNSGNNNLYGTNANDGMYGWAGNDILIGRGGHDYIMGGAGDDIIEGGTQSDKMWGDSRSNDSHTGADTFVFTQGDGWHDKIMDFEVTQGDKIEFGGQIDDWNFNGNQTAGDGTNGLCIQYSVDGNVSGSIILAGVNEQELAGTDWFFYS